MDIQSPIIIIGFIINYNNPIIKYIENKIEKNNES